MEILLRQYELIRERRETLFHYCSTLKTQHLAENLDAFGGRSIRFLMVHTSNNYHFWLGHFTGLNTMPFAASDTVHTVDEIRVLYKSVNELVNVFLKNFNHDIETPILGRIPQRDLQITVTPLQLYTQVITHEFHHKGQLLSMSRQLGYTPVDTDIIRFDE